MRIIVVIGAALILSGFLGWTVPISQDRTIVYLNYMCTSGNQNLSQEGGISCSLLNQLTYIVYALLVAGIILIATDIAFKNKKPFQKRIKT